MRFNIDTEILPLFMPLFIPAKKEKSY